MLITPHTFEGVRRTDYTTKRIQSAALGEQVYFLPRNALAVKAKTAREAGREIMDILKESGKAILLTEIRLATGMHAVGIGFEQTPNGNVKATYLDATGNRTPKNSVPFITHLIEGASLKGKTELETGIPVQQHQEQPNTCMLWLIKNTCDFLKTGEIAKPSTPEEADTIITAELNNYLEFERITTVNPNAGFDSYMQFTNS